MVYPIQLAALCTCMYIENCTSRRKSIRHDFASSELHTKEQTVHALKIQYNKSLEFYFSMSIELVQFIKEKLHYKKQEPKLYA